VNAALADIAEVVGEGRVSLDPEVLQRLSTDHSLESGEVAAAVVRPVRQTSSIASTIAPALSL